MFEDALAFFRNPNNLEWILVYDNVDDVDLRLSPLLPNCSQGSVIITTRNRSLGSFASNPELHLELDVMSEEEAVDTIICSSKSSASLGKEKEVAAIARELGYLPIALVQAGCYMFQTGCTDNEYLSGLQKHKAKMMGIPSGDRQNQSAYAAFDISYRRLHVPVKNFLHLLSFFHFAYFPMAVIPHAAKSLFTSDLFDFEVNSTEKEQSIQLLKETFCPEGHWNEMTLHAMCSTLQNYSLAAFSRAATTRLLRIHPLIHEWAFDIIPQDQKFLFRAAASRLVACANGEKHINFYLIPHIDGLLSRLSHHPIALDDRAAFATMFYETKRLKDAQALWQEIYNTLSQSLGSSSLLVATAALHLAASNSGNLKEMERLEREALRIRESALGIQHIDTLRAKTSLSRTLQKQGRMKAAEQLKEDIVAELTAQLGPSHPETRDALHWLASVYSYHGKFDKAVAIKKQLLAERMEELGEDHVDTLTSMVNLAATYRPMHRYEEAEELQKKAIEGRKRQLGDEHPETFNTISQLAYTYQRQGKFSEAETLAVQVLEGKKNLFGSDHLQTLAAMSDLSEIYHSQGRHLDAENLQVKVLEGRKKHLGENDSHVALAMHHLSCSYVSLGRLEDAKRLALEAEDIWAKTAGANQHRSKNTKLLRRLEIQMNS
jgi:tetratricopeptide (TPR) repeat protein